MAASHPSHPSPSKTPAPAQTGGSGPVAPTAGREETVDATTQRQAQQLVDQAGGPERAKMAIDSAQANDGGSPDEFARRWGFASYLELFEAATPQPARDGRSYLLAPLPGNRWVAWEAEAMEHAQVFESREAALAAFGQKATGQ